jgi:hypothetical protein
VKRNLPLLVAALICLAAGTLYGQFRSRNSDRNRSNTFGSSFGNSSSTAPATTAEGPTSGRSLPGEYVLLAQKSIFARDRRPYVPPRERREDTRPAETTAAPKPPAIPVLVGVLIGDDDLIAYIEDPDSGKLWPLAAGDPLPGTYGNVVKITLDDIIIAPENGPERRIGIGQNLAGEAVASKTASSSSESPTTSFATTAPAGDPNEPGISIEEKMRRRRLQQLGK